MNSLHSTAIRVLQFLEHDKSLVDNSTVQLCIKLLNDCKESASLHETNLEGLIQLAKDSEKSEFKIIARMNDDGPGYHVFGEWADDAHNFAFMCTNEKDDAEHKDGIYLKRTYSLEELPQALMNAQSWQNGVKKHKSFWTESIHIVAIK